MRDFTGYDMDKMGKVVFPAAPKWYFEGEAPPPPVKWTIRISEISVD